LNCIRFSLLVSAVVLAVLPGSPAIACRVNEAYEPGKPFDEAYFKEGDVIFRGHPVEYSYPNPDSPYSLESHSEVTFEVVDTFLGDSKEKWTARWFTIAFKKPQDLDAFKREIGDDLVVVLDAPEAYSTEFIQFPVVAHQPCGQPAMRSYEVMEPVLREKGLIE